MTAKLAEIDNHVTLAEQLQQKTGPVVLINKLSAAFKDVDQLFAVWKEDATFMKRQPGFISTQLHQGITGSTAFVNIAVRESAEALGAAFFSPDYPAHVAQYPDSTISKPHVFEKVAVQGICVA